MSTSVASNQVRDTRDYRPSAVRRCNKPFKVERNETHPRNSSNQCKRQSHSNAKSNSSQICKYWMNGNCVYGDRCWNLHSWFHSEHLSVLTRLNQHKKVRTWLSFAKSIKLDRVYFLARALNFKLWLQIVTGITLPVGSDKLFSCSTDGTLRMWDCHTGQCVNVKNLGDEARCLISMGPWVIAGIRNAIKVSS